MHVTSFFMKCHPTLNPLTLELEGPWPMMYILCNRLGNWGQTWVHFTLDHEGPRDQRIWTNEKSKWHPISWHQLDNVSWFIGCRIRPIQKRCVQHKTRGHGKELNRRWFLEHLNCYGGVMHYQLFWIINGDMLQSLNMVPIHWIPISHGTTFPWFSKALSFFMVTTLGLCVRWPKVQHQCTLLHYRLLWIIHGNMLQSLSMVPIHWILISHNMAFPGLFKALGL